MVFPIVVYGCESWIVKKAGSWRMDAFEVWCWRWLLKVPLDCKKTKPVDPKGNQPWIFTGKTDAKVEAPILWPPNVKSWLVRKDPDAGKDWRKEEKGMTEDEMVGWHHWLEGRKFEQALGECEGQGNLACYNPQGCKESDMPEWLNNSNMLCEWPCVTKSGAAQGIMF